MADNAPMEDIQPSEEEALPPEPDHLPSEEDIVKDSAPPPLDLIEPIKDNNATELPPLKLSSVPSSAHPIHDQSEHVTGIPPESDKGGTLVESATATEVAKLQDPKDEPVVKDNSVGFKPDDHNADALNEATNIISDAKDLHNVRTNEGSDIPLDDDDAGHDPKHGLISSADQPETEPKPVAGHEVAMTTPNKSFYQELSAAEGYESGTEEEQAAFRKDVESFYRENSLEFKAPKFYKEELNLLKLWRAVIKLGGYEQVTSCKLWRQVGESFRPPKTCTTVSWTFRIFYEKALLEYEKNKLRSGELPFSDGPLPESLRVESQAGGNQALGSGRARRDAAARAMQGWHSQRLLDNGEVCHPIIKDKNLSSVAKVENKQFKTNGAGLLKRKKPSGDEHALNIMPVKTMKSDSMVTDVGPPAEWVKINIRKMSECFEIYALVPGLLREEVHVQSDPAGRVIISGQPEQLDNPWGITPFKKVVSLPRRIDPHHTSAVVTLHGQLFVRVPFEQQGH